MGHVLQVGVTAKHLVDVQRRGRSSVRILIATKMLENVER